MTASSGRRRFEGAPRETGKVNRYHLILRELVQLLSCQLQFFHLILVLVGMASSAGVAMHICVSLLCVSYIVVLLYGVLVYSHYPSSFRLAH